MKDDQEAGLLEGVSPAIGVKINPLGGILGGGDSAAKPNLLGSLLGGGAAAAKPNPLGGLSLGGGGGGLGDLFKEKQAKMQEKIRETLKKKILADYNKKYEEFKKQAL